MRSSARTAPARRPRCARSPARSGGAARIELAGGRSCARGPESTARLGVAHVPEGRGTFSELTVWENLRLGAYVRRGSLREDFAASRQYFPWIEARRAQQAGTLSGGEQQMLALARAVMQRPRLLLLDEPSLGLAPLVVAEIFRILRELNEREGTAVLLVEQNARTSLATAARAYVLEVGQVAFEGTSDELASAGLDPTELPGILMAAVAASNGARRFALPPRGSFPRLSSPSCVFLVVGSLSSSLFAQQTISGLANGGIYASLAVALVLIYRATEVINFAQGALATFTTYVAWQLISWGLLVLGGVRLHARDRVRRRLPRRARGDPARRAPRLAAHGGDRCDRPADPRRGCDRLDLGQRGEVHAARRSRRTSTPSAASRSRGRT